VARRNLCRQVEDRQEARDAAGERRGGEAGARRQARLGDEADGNRLAVRQSVAAERLEGVPDGVPEVEDDPPAGFARVLAPFVAGAMRRANGKDLARLKSILEAS